MGLVGRDDWKSETLSSRFLYAGQPSMGERDVGLPLFSGLSFEAAGLNFVISLARLYSFNFGMQNH